MICRPELVDLILEGKKTETRRPVKAKETECRCRVGHDYAVQPGRTKHGVARIEVLSVRRNILAQIDRAKLEGFDHRVPFFRYWGGLYGSVDTE